jgi:ribosomal-protein-alanine N-acetyltransferase
MIRPFAEADLVSVYAIQLQCPQAAQWPQGEYLRCACDPAATVLVAELATNPREIAGFAVFHRVMDEAELRNIAVGPAHQRKGIARQLLAEGIGIMQSLGVRRLFLEVRASNQPALALYAGAGFKLLYTRPGYYQDPPEDALVMARDLAPGAGVRSVPR